MIKTKIIEAVENGLDVYDPNGEKIVFACLQYYSYSIGVRKAQSTEWPSTEEGLRRFRIVGTDEKADGQRYNIERPRYTAEEIRNAIPKGLHFAEKFIAEAVIEEVIANLEKA